MDDVVLGSRVNADLVWGDFNLIVELRTDDGKVLSRYSVDGIDGEHFYSADNLAALLMHAAHKMEILDGVFGKRMVEAVEGEMFFCPRRDEGPVIPGTEDGDHWTEDGTCSFCGGLRKEKIMELLDQGWTVEKTTKNYKLYINSPDDSKTKKIYLMHFTVDEQMELNNAKNI